MIFLKVIKETSNYKNQRVSKVFNQVHLHLYESTAQNFAMQNFKSYYCFGFTRSPQLHLKTRTSLQIELKSPEFFWVTSEEPPTKIAEKPIISQIFKNDPLPRSFDLLYLLHLFLLLFLRLSSSVSCFFDTFSTCNTKVCSLIEMLKLSKHKMRRKKHQFSCFLQLMWKIYKKA